jgi:hypothetical protein
MANLALVLDSVGEHSKAEKTNREILRLRENVFEQDYLDTLDNTNSTEEASRED